MSIGVLDVIERLPGELAARLEADSFFVDIPVVVADEGNVAASVAKKQAVITGKTGKAGIAVIVLQIVGDDEDTNVAFGPLRLRPAFQVVENRELNLGASGTQKSSRKVARQIIKIVKPLRLSGMTTDFEVDKPGIEPVQLTSDVAKNLIVYQVNFICMEADSEELEQVGMPHLDLIGSNFELTSSTPVAEIWFTTDDSFPSPLNVNAKRYEEQQVLPGVGTTIVRACAYLEGLVASQVGRWVIEGEDVETAN